MSYEPLGQGLWYFLTSFVGTLGFAILLHAPKRAWLPASLIGAMTYTLYWSLKPRQCSSRRCSGRCWRSFAQGKCA